MALQVKEVTNRDGDRDMQSNKRYVRTFQVLADHPTVGAKAVRDHVAVPAYGSRWESYRAGALIDFDEDARCVEKTAAQSDPDNLQNWTVTCRYVGVGDPTLEPPKVSWSGEKWQETKNTDVNGVLVANSANDPFEGGLTRDRTRGVVTIEMNVLTFDPIAAEAYRDTVNLERFLVARHPPGFGVGLCKIESIDAVPVYYPDYNPVTRNEIHYWRRTVRVAIDRNGWDATFLDAGFNEQIAIGAVDRWVRILDDTGQPCAVAQPLDGNGLRAARGAPPVFTDPFQRYELKDWTPLAIDY